MNPHKEPRSLYPSACEYWAALPVPSWRPSWATYSQLAHPPGTYCSLAGCVHAVHDWLLLSKSAVTSKPPLTSSKKSDINILRHPSVFQRFCKVWKEIVQNKYSSALLSSAQRGPRDQSEDTPTAPSTPHQPSPSPAEGGTRLKPCLPLSPFHCVHAPFILSTSVATGPYCWQKPPRKTPGTLLSLLRGKQVFQLSMKPVKSHREGRKRQDHQSSESHSYCRGRKVAVTAVLYTSSWSLKPASLPWQKQNELIKCLPLAYFGNLMECARAGMNFRPLLIASDAEEIIQAWEEGEEAKPVAKGY